MQGFIQRLRSRLQIRSRARRLFSRFQVLCCSHGIGLTRDHRKLLRIRNKHNGKRAFIVGMGPSLKIEDLDRLRSEITFGCNKCYLAFDQTSWRPTYYAVEDKLVFTNNIDAINNLSGFPRLYPKWVQSSILKTNETIFFDLKYSDNDHQKRKFSGNPAEIVYGGYSVTYILMQLAVYAGVKEIYLVGMDYSFALPEKELQLDSNFKAYVSEGETNHFHPDYRKPGETWVEPNLERQFVSFESAKEFAEENNIVLKNATRGGKLEVFDRVDFDSLF